MPEILVPLPHPTYRIPRQWFILRRVRRRQIPLPRSPSTHFFSDCISQHFTRSHRDVITTVQGVWHRMSNEQRMPWIQMAQKDVDVIAQLVPYYAECLRRGRQITDGGRANAKGSQAMPVLDYPTLLRDSSEIPVGPQTLLPPIVLFHGRRPVAFVQPVIVFDRTRWRPCACFYNSSTRETRQQDTPTAFSEVAPTLCTCMAEPPFFEAHRARYVPTPMRSTHQSQAQDTNHDQHEEVNSSPDPFTTTETQDNPSDSPDEQVEITFIEAQRNRYATPVRTTYYPPFATGSTAD
ncbi:hypothetical protein JOM56_005367 [Amanita muscaria]